jgi:bifunctional non-homologous end joining protein LigD
MLLRQNRSGPIAFIAFDVLSLDGTDTMREPYRKRRELLENLELAGPHWSITQQPVSSSRPIGTGSIRPGSRSASPHR